LFGVLSTFYGEVLILLYEIQVQDSIFELNHFVPKVIV